MVDPDKYTELLHQLDRMQERVDELTFENEKCYDAFRELAKYLYDDADHPLSTSKQTELAINTGLMTPPRSTKKPAQNKAEVSELVKTYTSMGRDNSSSDGLVQDVVSKYIPPQAQDSTLDVFEMKPRRRSNVDRLEQYLRELEKETEYE